MLSGRRGILRTRGPLFTECLPVSFVRGPLDESNGETIRVRIAIPCCCTRLGPLRPSCLSWLAISSGRSACERGDDDQLAHRALGLNWNVHTHAYPRHPERPLDIERDKMLTEIPERCWWVGWSSRTLRGGTFSSVGSTRQWILR